MKKYIPIQFKYDFLDKVPNPNHSGVNKVPFTGISIEKIEKKFFILFYRKDTRSHRI